MKKEEKKELFQAKKEELKVMAEKIRKEIAKIILERNAGKLKNISFLREKRKMLARVLTILRRKELVEK